MRDDNVPQIVLLKHPVIYEAGGIGIFFKSQEHKLKSLTRATLTLSLKGEGQHPGLRPSPFREKVAGGRMRGAISPVLSVYPTNHEKGNQGSPEKVPHTSSARRRPQVREAPDGARRVNIMNGIANHENLGGGKRSACMLLGTPYGSTQNFRTLFGIVREPSSREILPKVGAR